MGAPGPGVEIPRTWGPGIEAPHGGSRGGVPTKRVEAPESTSNPDWL